MQNDIEPICDWAAIRVPIWVSSFGMDDSLRSRDGWMNPFGMGGWIRWMKGMAPLARDGWESDPMGNVL